jgi:5-methylcytosine-specific restriction endonuclease McrA
MNTNVLALASGLSDHDLLTRLFALAGKEREATVELIAHLAALESRPSVYAAKGYGSLFAYCVEALRLSEDATCNRIAAARACRRFPAILEALGAGEMSLTSVRMLSPHLTDENWQTVLARAGGRSRGEIEALVAELAPRPDVPSSVRKLPATTILLPTPTADPPSQGVSQTETTAPTPPSIAAPLSPPAHRPVIEATSPERYRVQFTIGKESHDKLRRLQTLLRREIPDGDPAAIVDRALTLLLEKVERKKLGAAAKPRPARPIRPGTDTQGWRTISNSRDIPNDVRRGSWRRDGGQCGFVSADGHRCTERTFLEFHHVIPYAKGGRATVDNISLRCRRHNQYEAELVFGSRPPTRRQEEQRTRPRPFGGLPAEARSLPPTA